MNKESINQELLRASSLGRTHIVTALLKKRATLDEDFITEPPLCQKLKNSLCYIFNEIVNGLKDEPEEPEAPSHCNSHTPLNRFPRR